VTDLVVATTSGQLVPGTEDGLLRARGVPYGAAARFQAPAPAAWAGVRQATEPGPVCPQLPSRLGLMGSVVDGLRQDEDCLVLSVAAPTGAVRLPVMVWFHGGAYRTGAGEAPKYDPAKLVREGQVVVVNVNYRLGLFGYLTPQGQDNLGLLDQLLALRWVRDNIAAFGGDPEQVTIFGQSAGGDSVLSLMLAPEANGLFHRAIMQSAPLGLRDNRDRMTAALRATAQAALGPNPDAASVDDMLAAQASAAGAAQRFGQLSGMPFSPVLGQPPLPPATEVPARLAEAAQRVELLVGTTKDDASPFVTTNPKAQQLNRLGATGRALLRRITNRVTDRVFAAPAKALADTWRQHGGAVATYRFDWAPAGAPLGACHCIELPFLFGTDEAWADAPMLNGQQADPTIGMDMRQAWTSFAHKGVAALRSEELAF
jgi:para-nitrobenzyl esterase